ncbi:DUF4296 domain-containing protein [Leeuwenhoekiella sp. MAR_2009_132]|uniref:DUF4296 domain-containing protein n=1 Tax=Leeuwenhoekiella sp. MAR_2009_132 TaxID=1392489 RepID=UPI00048EAC9B|nr:DUF4296 domain-containing protein [Leeuwenhoekiella sp. MAR_2009_132]
MKRTGYIVMLSLLLLLSCNDIQKPKKPDNFIKKDLMTDILYDVSIMRTLRTYNMNEMRSLGIEPDSFIYKKYDIDSLQFAESINYYSVNFNEFTAIWEEVSKRLTEQRDKLQFAQNDQDSIRNVESKFKRDSIRKQVQLKDSLSKIEPTQDSLLAPIGD